MTTRAQIRVAAFDELVPHTGCGFMEPLKGPDGSALYYPDGKLILRPSRTWAAVQPLSYDSTFYGDPNSPNLRALRVILDGYLRQGYTSMRTVEANFDIADNVPVEPQFDKGAGKFQKFVYYLAGYRSGLATWPNDGIRNPRLKTGCSRTIGDGSPDFCTRVDVLAKSTQFRFEAKHNCAGSGNAATGYTFGCPATPIAPVTATSHDHWACMYFSYHDVLKPGECKRQFRGYCRNGDGCFAPETKIKLKDGREKRVNELVVGDEVWTLAGRAAKVQTMIVGPEAKPLYEVGILGRTVKVTDKHPFKTRGGLKNAAELTAADELLGEDGLYHRLTALRQLPVDPDQMVWNVRLDAEPGDTLGHVLIADGVPAGDLHLQQKDARTLTLEAALDQHYGP